METKEKEEGEKEDEEEQEQENKKEKQDKEEEQDKQGAGGLTSDQAASLHARRAGVGGSCTFFAFENRQKDGLKLRRERVRE